MKKTTSILIFTLLAATLCLATCDMETVVDTQKFDYYLRGIWESNSPTYPSYSGTLEIDYNYITISGYEYYYPESSRPFVEFSRNTPLKGYSVKTRNLDKNIDGYEGQEGTLYINQPGKGEIAIDYMYYVTGPYNNIQTRLKISSTNGWQDEFKPVYVE